MLLNMWSVFDLVGRAVVIYRFGFNKDNIWLLILSQALVFIPVASCCVLGLIPDAISIILSMLIGFFNGYTISLSIILCGECDIDESNRGAAGILIGFTIYCGLTCGSYLSLLLNLAIMA